VRRSNDPQTLILVHLLRAKTKVDRTIRSISEATGVSRTAVRNNLIVMERIGQRRYSTPDWVGREEGRPMTWVLTDKGREIARDRARRVPKPDGRSGAFGWLD
jgi:predicted ArsR family transcriptional regulator